MKRLIKIAVAVFIAVLVFGVTAITTSDNRNTPVIYSALTEIPAEAVMHLFEVLDSSLEYDVVLTDLLTGDNLGGATLAEDGITVFEVFNFENGYHGALVGFANPLFDDEDWDDEDWDDEDWDDEDWDDEDWDDEDWDDEDWDDEDWDDEDWDDEDWDDEDWDDEDWDDEDWDDEDWVDDDWDEEDWVDDDWDGDWYDDDDDFFANYSEDLRYLIFDSELNIVHDILITDPYLLVSWDHFTTYVTYDNDELKVYYVPDLFHLVENQPHGVFKYNATTGETVEIAVLEDPDLFIEHMVVIDEDTIAFTALNLELEVSELYYATIDIASGDITMLTEAAFLNSGITSVSNYVLLNEGHLTSLEMDEDERIWARLSLDASYVVTVTSDFTAFRKYDMTNGEIILEVEFELDHQEEPWEVDIYAITDSTYAVHFLSALGVRTVALVEVP